MSDLTPSEEARQRIFERIILPVVFPEARSETPTLVLLGGQAGAGNSRATARVLAQSPRDMVALRGEDLEAFHPNFLALKGSRSPDAPQILSEAAASWLRDCIRHARTTKRSLLLEGSFQTPQVALGTADLFAKHGFATRIAVVATPRAESLLSTASRYLLEARSGRASQFTSVANHDAGWAGTRALIGELENMPSVDRLTVIGRDGTPHFDVERSAPDGFTGAARRLVREQSAAMSSTTAMRWLSELRAMTDYTLSSERSPGPLFELLIELHDVALNEVLPRLELPADSRARPAAEASLARQLVELRRTVAVEPSRYEDLAGPVVQPSRPDGGISR